MTISADDKRGRSGRWENHGLSTRDSVSSSSESHLRLALIRLVEEGLESEEFYNLMLAYRHASRLDLGATQATFEAVKAWVRALLASPPSPGEP